jgi:hypothetical protein
MYIDLTRFLAAVDTLTNLWRRELLRFEVTPQGGVALNFDDSAMAQAPPAGEGMYADLEDAINASAVGTALDEFVRVRGQPRPNFPEPEAREVATQKYQAVQQLVREAHVAARVILSVTSKMPVLAKHDWEVVRREADSSRQPGTQTGRYGILRLTTEQLPAVSWESARDVTVFAVDADRLQVLINDLSRFSDALMPEREESTASTSVPGASEANDR